MEVVNAILFVDIGMLVFGGIGEETNDNIEETQTEDFSL